MGAPGRGHVTTVTETGFAITALAWLAYVASRLLQKRRLPELVGFLLVGALLGPSALGLIGERGLRDLEPFTQIALALLMFMIGERVSVRALRATSWVGPAAVLQYVACAGIVFAGVRLAGASEAAALLLAAVAGAGAPMTVAAVAASSRATGQYARALVGTHATADALAALGFAVALPAARLSIGDGGGLDDALLDFVRLGIGAAALGALLGWVVSRFGSQIETSGELLLFAVVHVLVAAAVSASLGLSLPLAALVMGATTSTLGPREQAQRLFVAVRAIEQPLYLVFFALAGASIHLDALPELGAVGAAYVVARLLGKLLGALATGLLTSLPLRRSGRLAADLVPQAGVAVGLAVLAAEELPILGADVATVVLGSVVVFELVGPLLVARGLREDPGALTPPGEDPPADEELPSVVLVACPAAVTVPPWVAEWCGRSGATLCLLGPAGTADDVVERIGADLAGDLVAFRWEPMDGESFAGATIRAARRLGADLVVIGPPRSTRSSSRLVLHPEERIARQLDCPVLLLGGRRVAPGTRAST